MLCLKLIRFVIVLFHSNPMQTEILVNNGCHNECCCCINAGPTKIHGLVPSNLNYS